MRLAIKLFWELDSHILYVYDLSCYQMSHV